MGIWIFNRRRLYERPRDSPLVKPALNIRIYLLRFLGRDISQLQVLRPLPFSLQPVSFCQCDAKSAVGQISPGVFLSKVIVGAIICDIVNALFRGSLRLSHDT